MHIDFHSTERPNYPQPTFTGKAAIAFVAALMSNTLLVGMLSMFDARSQEAALARASFKSQPSTGGLAVRKVDSGPRGLTDGQPDHRGGDAHGLSCPPIA